MVVNLDVYKEDIIHPERFDNKAGIYSIKLMGQIVYIGKSINMVNRVAQHIREYQINSNSNKYKILHQAYERDLPIEFDVLYYSTKHTEEDIGEVEGILIRHYKPILNYQIPKEEDWRHYTTNPIATTITYEEVMDLIEEMRKNKKS